MFMNLRIIATRTAAVAALTVAALTASPASVAAADREHQQMMAELRILQEQTQQLQALLGRLGDALTAVNTRLDDQTALERKAFADGKVQMDGVSGDLRIVREKVDETNVRLSSLSQELESLRSAIPDPGVAAAPPPAAADAGAATIDTTQAPPPSPTGTAATTPPPAGVSPQRLFDTARADYAAGDYSMAIQGFESYLRSFPKYSNAPDAQLLIGESYRLAGKNAEAVAAYDRVIANYPGSSSIAQAYYKRGMSLENLKDFARAIESHQTVVKQFPDSAEANLARQRLTALSKTAQGAGKD
jgi:tol-pal system protein YbgF